MTTSTQVASPSRPSFKCTLATALLTLCALLLPAWAQAQRVALLIGNHSYALAPLRNPPNDVREMEGALTALGFKVQKVLDANQNQMKRALRDFGTSAQGAEIALLYYSGHGTQVAGENYLLPIGATVDKEADYEVEAVSANAALRQIAGARPRAAVVILDACRDNPHASATRSTAKGLVRMDAPTGTAIAFATAPNTTASDDGHFARVLAAQLRKPGQELFDVFRNTITEVRLLSNQKQEPRVSEWSITDRIYLAGMVQAPTSAPVAVPPIARPDALSPAPAITLSCAECGEMALIPAGVFMMGSPDGEPGHSLDEGPQRCVTVRSFLLGRYEVTQAQWRTVMGSNPSASRQCGDNCPVGNVSWDDVQAFIQRLNARTGVAWRLPTEAEWEYATRAGTTTAYPWGASASHEWMNYGADQCCSGLAEGRDRWIGMAPVGQFPANAFGLHDMQGNVWEWVQDCYDDKAYRGKAPNDGQAYGVES